jgi:hypothetical protein
MNLRTAGIPTRHQGKRERGHFADLELRSLTRIPYSCSGRVEQEVGSRSILIRAAPPCWLLAVVLFVRNSGVQYHQVK